MVHSIKTNRGEIVFNFNIISSNKILSIYRIRNKKKLHIYCESQQFAWTKYISENFILELRDFHGIHPYSLDIYSIIVVCASHGMKTLVTSCKFDANDG